MNRLCKFTLGLAAASVIAVVPAGPSLADPPGDLMQIPRHQHVLVTPNGDRRRIGPNLCDNPDLQEAFNQFHYNIHHNSGDPTKGPQGGAPGLHDEIAADMDFEACDE